MRYVSTRGDAPVLGFGDALLAGLADDGGLYVPESWPKLAAGGTGDYVATALEVMAPFVGGAIAPGAFADMVRDAYATFEADDVTPLVDLGDGHCEGADMAEGDRGDQGAQAEASGVASEAGQGRPGIGGTG